MRTIQPVNNQVLVVVIAKGGVALDDDLWLFDDYGVLALVTGDRQ